MFKRCGHGQYDGGRTKMSLRYPCLAGMPTARSASVTAYTDFDREIVAPRFEILALFLGEWTLFVGSFSPPGI